MRIRYNPEFDNYLKVTRTKLAVLYDAQTRVAWMLPQICVVIHCYKRGFVWQNRGN